jgi:hypothetical protein
MAHEIQRAKVLGARADGGDQESECEDNQPSLQSDRFHLSTKAAMLRSARLQYNSETEPDMTLRTLLFALIALTGMTITQAAELTDSQQQAIETKIQELRDRLALTPEQEQKIAPLLEARNQKLRELRAKYGEDASRREKLGMMREAKAIQKDFDGQLQPILTKDQWQQWQQFRDETRAAARERYRNRQN